MDEARKGQRQGAETVSDDADEDERSVAVPFATLYSPEAMALFSVYRC